MKKGDLVYITTNLDLWGEDMKEIGIEANEKVPIHEIMPNDNVGGGNKTYCHMCHNNSECKDKTNCVALIQVKGKTGQTTYVPNIFIRQRMTIKDFIRSCR